MIMSIVITSTDLVIRARRSLRASSCYLIAFAALLALVGLASCEQKLQSWRSDDIIVLGEPPSPRFTPFSAASNTKLFVHAGTGTTGFTNDLFQFDRQTMRWTQFSPDKVQGTPPPPATDGGMVVYNNSLYLFGGYSALLQDYTNEMFKFDLEKLVWTQIYSKNGFTPEPRVHPGTVLVSQIIYVFGGAQNLRVCEKCGHNDLYSFDPNTEEWTDLRDKVTGDCPPPLYIPSVTSDGSSRIFVFGGLVDRFDLKPFNADVFKSDVHMFDTIKQDWTLLVPRSETVPEGRSIAGFTYWKNTLFIFGGWRFSGTFCDLYQFDLETLSWSFITSQVMEINIRRYVVFQVVDNWLVVFGGTEDLVSLPPFFDLKKNQGDLFVYDLNAPSIFDRDWVSLSVSHPTPTGRTYSALVPSDSGELFLFGGWADKQGRLLNDMHMLDPITLRWGAIPAVQDGPTKRWGYAMVSYQYALLLFGGFNEIGPLSDIFVFNASTYRWSEMKSADVQGSLPSPRGGVGMASTLEKVFIFGGATNWTFPSSGAFFNDLFELDPKHLRMVRLDSTLCQGSSPSPRFLMGITAINGSLFIFGGQGDSVAFQDLFEFKVTSREWVEHHSHSALWPSPRFAPALASSEGKLLLIGGATFKESMDHFTVDGFYLSSPTYDDFYSYDPAKREWKALSVSGISPPRRNGAGICIWNQNLYLFGGFGGPGSGFLNDLWSISIPKDILWPDGGLPGLFIDVYDWDTVIIDSKRENILSWPLDLCTGFFPCSLVVESRDNGLLLREPEGSFSCTESKDNARLMIFGLAFGKCDSWTDGGIINGFGGAAVVKIDKSTFENIQTSTVGGAIAAYGGRWTLSNSSFERNSAAQGGGAILISQFSKRYGSTESIEARMSINSCIFKDCTSQNDGGAIYATTQQTNIDIFDSSFISCRSMSSGGAIFISEMANISILLSVFYSNSAQVSGGAICVQNAHLKLLHEAGSSNVAVKGGGGLLYWHGQFRPDLSDSDKKNHELCENQNSAVYGNCFASSYHSLTAVGVPALNAPSLPGIPFQVSVLKKDAYNHTIVTDSVSLVQAKLVGNSDGSGISGAFGKFEQGVAVLNLQIRPLFSEVNPSQNLTVLTDQPHLIFTAVDPETLGTMSSAIFDVAVAQGNEVCPVGSILALDNLQSTSVYLGSCSACAPGTYSIRPLAGATSQLPACLNCPEEATCKGGADVTFSIGRWISSAGLYILIGCPPGYQLINSDFSGIFRHDLQRCRKCQLNQYIVDSNRSDFSCQNCPTGAKCDGSKLSPQTQGSLWIANATTGIYWLELCPEGLVPVVSSSENQQCAAWTAPTFVSLKLQFQSQLEQSQTASILQAIANVASVPKNSLMIESITRSNEGRRADNVDMGMVIRLAAANASSAQSIQSRLTKSTINAALAANGLPAITSTYSNIIVTNQQNDGLPLSIVIGISFATPILFFGLAAALYVSLRKMYRYAAHKAFVMALQNAKVGDKLGPNVLPLELRSLYSAESVLGIGSFGYVVSAVRKANTLTNRSLSENSSKKAYSQSLPKQIACKFFLPSKGFFGDQELRQLKREAHALRLFIRNQADTAVHLIGEAHLSSKLCWFEMELLRGDNLEVLIRPEREGPLSDSECICVARCVLATLAFMHGEGLVHRDIKPSNIMCGKDLATGHRRKDCDYDYKLIDFGTVLGIDETLAKEEMMTVVRAQQMGAGTPPYMSPEMFMHPERASYATDLWSLGVTLFETATGLLPFLAESNWLWSVRIAGDMDEPPPSVLDAMEPDRRAHFDSALAGVIERALEKKTERRFKTANEMFEAIYGCLVRRGDAFYSAFISYRVASEAPLARLLFDELNHSITPGGHRVTVFWDSKHLREGDNWKKGFGIGLLNSLCYLPVLSYGFTAPLAALPDSQRESGPLDWEMLPMGRRRLRGDDADPEDNVLKELLIASSLISSKDSDRRGRRGILQAICPLLVGRPHPPGHPAYPGMGSFFTVERGGGQYPEQPSGPSNADVVRFLREDGGMPEEILADAGRRSVHAAVREAALEMQGLRLWETTEKAEGVELSHAQRELIGQGYVGPAVNLPGDTPMTEQQWKQCLARGLDENQLKMLKAQMRAKKAELHRVIDRAVDKAAAQELLSQTESAANTSDGKKGLRGGAGLGLSSRGFDGNRELSFKDPTGEFVMLHSQQE